MQVDFSILFSCLDIKHVCEFTVVVTCSANACVCAYLNSDYPPFLCNANGKKDNILC